MKCVHAGSPWDTMRNHDADSQGHRHRHRHRHRRRHCRRHRHRRRRHHLSKSSTQLLLHFCTRELPHRLSRVVSRGPIRIVPGKLLEEPRNDHVQRLLQNKGSCRIDDLRRDRRPLGNHEPHFCVCNTRDRFAPAFFSLPLDNILAADCVREEEKTEPILH